MAAAVGIAFATAPTSVHAGYVPAARPQPAPSTAATPGPTAAAAGPTAPPTLVSIPSLGVSAPVVPVGVAADGSLGVPDDPRTLGWWSGGAPAGAAVGSTVLDGHVDSATRGIGALFTLRRVQVGASVLVKAGGRSLIYRVTGVREYPKSALPATVFSQGVAGRLVLITCGGSFDYTTRHYADNIVAYAVPVTG